MIKLIIIVAFISATQFQIEAAGCDRLDQDSLITICDLICNKCNGPELCALDTKLNSSRCKSICLDGINYDHGTCKNSSLRLPTLDEEKQKRFFHKFHRDGGDKLKKCIEDHGSNWIAPDGLCHRVSGYCCKEGTLLLTPPQRAFNAKQCLKHPYSSVAQLSCGLIIVFTTN